MRGLVQDRCASDDVEQGGGYAPHDVLPDRG